MDPSRIQRALDSLIYRPLLKDSSTQPPDPEPDALQQPGSHRQCRPWDRGDLLRRLQSFRPATWFCKPACAGPVACARRGWANTGLDQLTCETCGAKLNFILPPRLPLRDVERAGAVFAERLDQGHDASCPWLGNACDPSVAQFPPLARPVVLADFEERLRAIGGLVALPPVAPAAFAAVERSHRRSRLQQLMDHGPAKEPASLPSATPAAESATEPRASSGATRPASAPCANGTAAREGFSAGVAEESLACHGTVEFLRRQRLLALCGWGVQQLRASTAAAPGPGQNPNPACVMPAADAALTCALCGAKGGMWQYVPRVAPASSSLSAPAAALHARTAPPALPQVALQRTIAGGPLASVFGAHPSAGSAPGAAVDARAAGEGAAAAGPFGRAAGKAAPVFGIAAMRRGLDGSAPATSAPAPAPVAPGQKRAAEADGDGAESSSKRMRRSEPDTPPGAPAAIEGLEQGRGLRGERRFDVPVASNVAFYCSSNCDIKVMTGSEHEAVVVQAHWLPDARENPLFTFRQFGPELEVFQWRRPGAEQAQHAASTLSVHIPERFCSLNIYDGGNISVAKIKEAALCVHTRTGNVSFGSVSATHAHIVAEAGSVTGGSLTAADVAVAAATGLRMDKLTGLRVEIGQGSGAGASGGVHIGAVYCEEQLHIECQGASEGLYLGSLSCGEGGVALVQRSAGTPVEVGGFEGACLGVWAAGGRVSFHAQRAARRVFVDSGGGPIAGDFVAAPALPILAPVPAAPEDGRLAAGATRFCVASAIFLISAAELCLKAAAPAVSVGVAGLAAVAAGAAALLRGWLVC
ncbi:hypothetical protein WJX81_004029 [Elliptochloris bilobata]|uniref:C3HC-type domain-containing protein n=1 Tax=Elliptochloris bilobata TaxID=381761 RepID=A0AAW1SK68_9CHLO